MFFSSFFIVFHKHAHAHMFPRSNFFFENSNSQFYFWQLESASFHVDTEIPEAGKPEGASTKETIFCFYLGQI